MVNPEFLEPERYELFGGPSYRFDLHRRDFFKLLGSGILVLGLVDSVEGQESGGGRRRGGAPIPQEIGAWLHIGGDGTVTAFTGKAEVGQNIRTSLSQAIAEELRVPVASVKLTMADTDVTPYDAGTFGSRTTPDMIPRLRKVAATTREILLDQAAEVLHSDRAQLRVADGQITHETSGSSADFAELAKGQALLKTTPIGQPNLSAPTTWNVLGQSVAKIDGRDFVTGKHRFTTDLKAPGMLCGRVARPPVFGATLGPVDSGHARTLPDVTIVRDGNFLGVTAPQADSASAALSALKAEWSAPAQRPSGDLYESLKGTDGARGNSTKGNVEEGFAGAEKKLSASYTVAYIAHAPLEPRAAIAQWEGEKLTVWTGTQRPFGVRAELSKAFGIPDSQVRVMVPDTGSGYGGKHTGEAAIEAARLAKRAGKPVRLVWTREEEFTWAYFRPAGVIEVQSGFRGDGTMTAWDFHNFNAGGSGIATLYDIPHQRVQFHRAESPLRQGSYRGLAATANHFAREVHMDEVAHALDKDPLKFRLQNLKEARLRAVFERAAEAFGWGKQRGGNGRGFGFGGGFEKGGYVATFAEVSADKDLKRVQVQRVVTAFECGAVVNPDHLKSQIEGAVVMGLGGALTEEIQFADGKILNASFSRYRVPRFTDTPPVIETVLVDRKDLPSVGAGETPIVGIAPELSNAIVSATGVRLRALPMLHRSRRA